MKRSEDTTTGERVSSTLSHLLRIKLQLSGGKSLPDEPSSGHCILRIKQNKTYSPYAKYTIRVTKEVNYPNYSRNRYFKDEKPLVSINLNTWDNLAPGCDWSLSKFFPLHSISINLIHMATTSQEPRLTGTMPAIKPDVNFKVMYDAFSSQL
jgi:hypothetical protein